MSKISLFCLALSLSALSTSGNAASQKYCEAYTERSIQQYLTHQQISCDFTHERWNNNREQQQQWCLNISENQADNETHARDQLLAVCEIAEESFFTQ